MFFCPNGIRNIILLKNGPFEIIRDLKCPTQAELDGNYYLTIWTLTE